MLLAIEVGNTNTVLGIYSGEKLLADWRMETHRTRMADEWAGLLITLAGHKGYTLTDIDAAICSSVVPPVTVVVRLVPVLSKVSALSVLAMPNRLLA